MTHANPPQASDAKRRILVIDDDAFQSATVRRALEGTGKFAVMELNDPRHARHAAHSFHPELILLDVMMPHKDGGQLAAELRASPETRHIPIVFLTAALEPSEVETQGAMIGGFPFVAKPARKSDLVRVIEDNLPEAAP